MNKKPQSQAISLSFGLIHRQQFIMYPFRATFTAPFAAQ